MGKRTLVIQGMVAVCFLIPLVLFVAGCLVFLPRRFAIMVIGLAGFTVMVVGPFWAMQLEKTLRDKFVLRKEERSRGDDGHGPGSTTE